MESESQRSLLDLLLASGPLVWPILAASIVMLLCVIERTIALRRRRVAPKRFVQCLLTQVEENGDKEAALELCEEEPSLIARVFEAGLRRWGKPAVEVEQAVLDEGERSAAALRRYLRVISGVGNISPLLGLLGTVWGMRVAFDQIAGSSAMGRPELLAGGISQALLSTASGLAVAIPAMIFYLHFTGRADSLVMEIDRHGQSLVNLISAEAIEDRRGGRRKRAA